jgi:mRNA interferase RelE/StbE
MKIELHKSVRKFILRLQPKEQKRILNAIFKLPKGDVKPLASRRGEFRLRIGDWRVIFKYRENIIFVMEIDSRGGIY